MKIKIIASPKSGLIAGAAIVTFLYLVFFFSILGVGRGRAFLASENYLSAIIAAGLLAAIIGSGTGGLYSVANDAKNSGEIKNARLILAVGNGAIALGMVLIFGRFAKFNWNYFLENRPQASAFLAAALLAFIVFGVGLYDLRNGKPGED